MGSEQLPRMDQMHEQLVSTAKGWVKGQAKLIEGHFPTLKDGSQGLIIGISSVASWHEVLRPDGRIDWVDYYSHEQHRSFPDQHYLASSVLQEVELGVDKVRAELVQADSNAGIGRQPTAGFWPRRKGNNPTRIV